MNILFIAPPSEFTQGIKRTLERRGARVFYINERTNYLVPRPWRESMLLWTFTIRKFQFLKKINKNIFNRRLLKLITTFRPDILLTTKGTTIRSSTLDVYRSRGIKTVNWWMENPYYPLYWPWVKKHYADFQYFLVVGSAAVQDLPSTLRCRVYFLPPAVNGETFEQINITDEDRKRYACDVCFVGARYPEREVMLSAVAQLGVKLKIFGWHDWKTSPLVSFWHGPLTPREFAKAFRIATISLNSNLYPTQGSVNRKTFEILAAGGFELCDYQEDITKLFGEGKEIEIYRSTEELLTKIKYYLANPDQRDRIANAGHARVMRDHTLDARVEALLNTIQ